MKGKELNQKDYDIWALNNPPGYLNYFGRKSLTQENQPNIFDKFEIELLTHTVDFIQ